MSITLYENLISFIEAARILPERPHVSTLWRWSTRGVRNVRLETWLVGGRRYTSREALDRFIAATTAAATAGEEPPTQTHPQRQRVIEQAERELREAGI